jgi:hypothetical protein
MLNHCVDEYLCGIDGLIEVSTIVFNAECADSAPAKATGRTSDFCNAVDTAVCILEPKFN